MANRLAVIHDGSMPRQWRKVGTKGNPPDDVSRGLNGFDMISSDRWKPGLEFLWQEETAWPTNSAVPEIVCVAFQMCSMMLGIGGDTACPERIKN